ncbi:NAD(P)H-binding protein [Rhodovastum atsumiense]|uniref:NAD(P)H-binding protein n=2 Tax=Rhodovastum atsumiense TaxID=504468 RepID=A0A5M6IPV2_9PROT|nr:NAD(P)H-binding protein [Rhodovastum atsumiense]CAH2602213.1 NAD(P)H-binding protein [Rhodovastum atsumiense]
MRILVFGATGGTGRAVVGTLLAAGHAVTAFVRDPAALPPLPGLGVASGDAMRLADVAPAVAGQDAVVVSLGITQRQGGLVPRMPRGGPPYVCEAGTANVIAAMQAAGVARLVCVTAFGVGDTRDAVSLPFRIIFRLFMRALMADKERQEVLVKASGLDWTLVQPVGLTDQPASGRWVASTDGRIGRSTVSRVDLGAFIAEEVTARRHLHETVVFSG